MKCASASTDLYFSASTSSVGSGVPAMSLLAPEITAHIFFQVVHVELPFIPASGFRVTKTSDALFVLGEVSNASSRHSYRAQ